MTTQFDSILESALAWHLASERDDMDWDGFTEWLDADPRHREAYDEIALSDAAVAEHADELFEIAEESAPAANDDVVPTPAGIIRRWTPWVGGAIAASLVALAIVPQLQGPAIQTYATGATVQTIALDDGSTIELAPNSKLTIEGERQEHLALEGGAWFAIRHDASRPMTIRAGAISISDIGTSFDVQAAAGQVRVEVAEGEVAVSSAVLSRPVKLVAGRGFQFDSKAGTALTIPVSEGEFGEWREGRLTFDTAPLTLVAADLSRYAGIKVAFAEGVKDRHFSGTLATGDGEAALRDLAQLMALDMVRDGDGYRLEPAAR